VYKVSDDYTGLQEIFSHLQDTSSYRATFCAAMQKYVLYSNDKSEALKSIFDACGDTYKDFFRRMELFISIENQLDDKLLTTDVYKDPLLNAYKLLSFQQLLYNDLIAQRIQPSQYTSYMDFVNHLLQE